MSDIIRDFDRYMGNEPEAPYEPTREQLQGQLAYAIAEGKDVEAASLRREIAGLDAPEVREKWVIAATARAIHRWKHPTKDMDKCTCRADARWAVGATRR